MAGALVVLAGLVVAALAFARALPTGARPAAATRTMTGGPPPASPSATPTPSPPPSAPFAVGLHVVTFVDHRREVLPPHTASGRPEPRVLRTDVWYPALGTPGTSDVAEAPPALAGGPFPLVVFGPGFDMYPSAYEPLLHAWARAGFVVVAPTFPLTNPGTPGGPYEADMVNQPRDMAFVTTRILELSSARTGFLQGMVDAAEIAVAGQSDGGDTALADAYSSCCRDPRVRAAVILSGQQLLPGTYGPPGGPPLLAAQGTGDTINVPEDTTQLYEDARPPKYLLLLLGADHLEPYTARTPWEKVVVRASIAFLDAELKGVPGALARMRAVGNAPGIATLSGG